MRLKCLYPSQPTLFRACSEVALLSDRLLKGVLCCTGTPLADCEKLVQLFFSSPVCFLVGPEAKEQISGHKTVLAVCARDKLLVLWLCSWFELPIFAANHVGFFSQRRLQGCKMVSNDTWKLDLDVFSRNLWCRSLSDRVSLRMNQRWNSRAASWRRGDWEDLCVVN